MERNQTKFPEHEAVRLSGVSETLPAESEAGQEALAARYKELLEKLMGVNSRIFRSFSKLERSNLPEEKISPIQNEIVGKTRELIGKYPTEDYRMFHVLSSSGRFEKLEHFDFPGDDSVIKFLDRLAEKYLAEEEKQEIAVA